MQPLATNRNEEYKLAQRPFSLFDRRTLSALVLLSVAHCTSAAEEPLRWSRSFGQPPDWNKLRPVPGFWF